MDDTFELRVVVGARRHKAIEDLKDALRRRHGRRFTTRELALEALDKMLERYAAEEEAR